MDQSPDELQAHWAYLFLSHLGKLQQYNRCNKKLRGRATACQQLSSTVQYLKLSLLLSVTLASTRTNKCCSVFFTCPSTDINEVDVCCYQHTSTVVHTNLLTTLHESCEDSLMCCVSASPSAAINAVRRLVLSTYWTVQICGQHSTLHRYKVRYWLKIAIFFIFQASRRNIAIRLGIQNKRSK